MPGPLEGIKVLDVCQAAVGPWAGTLLGQLGAAVTKVEPTEGDSIRDRAPTKNGMSTTYMVMNLGKRGVTLDLKQDRDRAIALRLACQADVLIENYRPGAIDRMGLAYELVSSYNPRIVYCSSSSYGSRGPLKQMGSAEPYAKAFSGFNSLNGLPGGRPEAPRLAHMDLTASQHIVEAVIAGLLARAATGRGQRIEMSQMESSISIQASRAVEYLACGILPKPMGSALPNIVPSQVFRARDGKFLAVSALNEQEWLRLCQALGNPGLAKDPRFVTNRARVENRAQLIPILEKKFEERTAEEWESHLVEHGVPCAGFRTYDQIRSDAHARQNGWVADVDTPWGEIKAGGMPWQFGESNGEVRPPPRPGQHTEEVLSALPSLPAKASVLPASEGRLISGPLHGYRVLELTQGIAGPFVAMHLADMGAEVLKLEPPGGDYSRGLGPPFLAGESALFLSLNRNKKSAVLDIQSTSGREELLRLIPQYDVLLLDHLPEEARRLGITYEALQKLNPKLVYCSITAMGTKGPEKDRNAGELEAQALSGIWRYLGVAGQPPLRFGAHMASLNAGIFAVQGVLAALYRRLQTGRGQWVDVSLVGSLISMQTIFWGAESGPDRWDGHLLRATSPPDYGLKVKDGYVILGFQRERSGSDPWQEFCRRIGLASIIDDPRFQNRIDRGQHHRDELEALYEEALKNTPVSEVLELVQGLGGSAVPVQTLDQVFSHPQVLDNEMIMEVSHPLAGRVKMVGFPWKFSLTPPKLRLAPPLLGQHTDEVLATVPPAVDRGSQ